MNWIKFQVNEERINLVNQENRKYVNLETGEIETREEHLARIKPICDSARINYNKYYGKDQNETLDTVLPKKRKKRRIKK